MNEKALRTKSDSLGCAHNSKLVQESKLLVDANTGC